MELEISKNIVNWYPFQKDMKILFIGESQETICNMLRQVCQDVVVVTENLENISLEEKTFDIILLIGIVGILPQLMPSNPTLLGVLNRLKPQLTENRSIFIGNRQ